MSTTSGKKITTQAPEGERWLQSPVSRRNFLIGATGVIAWPWLGDGAHADDHGAGVKLSADTVAALENSPFVYVSPIRSDGEESRCHGEVWYGWFEGSVFLTVATSTWKARSVGKGLSTARIWVGDYGRWKSVLGRNNAFLEGPSFDAKVVQAKDPALVTRLLGELARKYPDEFPSWKDRMEKGHKDGGRILLRYTPIA